jgi:hypothetical protein
MTMAELDAVLAHVWVGKRAPPMPEQIVAVQEHFGGELTEELRMIWNASDGLSLGQFEAELLGPSAVLELVEQKRWPERFRARGLLPLVSDQQSSYVVAHVATPLAPRLSYLPNDDGPTIVYRNVASLLGDLLCGFESGETADFFLGERSGDYAPDAPRTPQDVADAKTLLVAGDAEALRGAIALLDDSCLEDWARLLETDHFVRRDARLRMRAMPAPQIQALLLADAAAFQTFAELAARAAKQAGKPVGERTEESLRVDGRWINLDALFYRRNIPDAFERLVRWFAAGTSVEARRDSGYLPG